jgi:hypothetical protein
MAMHRGLASSLRGPGAARLGVAPGQRPAPLAGRLRGAHFAAAAVKRVAVKATIEEETADAQQPDHEPSAAAGGVADAIAPPEAAPKKRGRKPKVAVADAEPDGMPAPDATAGGVAVAAAPPEEAPKKRGRKPKVAVADAATEADGMPATAAPPKPKRAYRRAVPGLDGMPWATADAATQQQALQEYEQARGETVTARRAARRSKRGSEAFLEGDAVTKEILAKTLTTQPGGWVWATRMACDAWCPHARSPAGGPHTSGPATSRAGSACARGHPRPRRCTRARTDPARHVRPPCAGTCPSTAAALARARSSGGASG